MKKRTWIRARTGALAVIVFAVILLPGLRSEPLQQRGRGGRGQAEPTGPLAPEKYKNIQALTNVPADQLVLAMQFVSAAVDMQCVNCHVQDATTGEFAYEKDDKRAKQTARNMMKMVNAINAGGFGVNVNCGTCHAGRNEPAGLQLAQMMTPDEIARANALAAFRRGAGRGGAAARGGRGGFARGGGRGGFGRGAQPPGPPVDDVLNKYVDAIGGRTAVDKLQSLTLTGTVTTRARENLAFTIDEKANKYREALQTKPDATIHGFDGSAGWMQTGAQTASLTGFALDEALRMDDFGLALNLKDKYPMLQTSGRPQQINGKDTTVVTGRQGVTTEQFYFETASGLLVRRTITTRTPLGQLREQIDYSNYKSVGGVKVPFEITRSNWNTLDAFKVTNAKPNATIDDAKFMKPKG